MSTPQLTREELLRAVPEMDGSISLDGIEDRVDIWRDRWGIPHVLANSRDDAFFGQGFAHAQDRLWAMDADRRRARGRWAEVVGRAGLDQDLLFRRFRLEASARADYEEGINAETRAMLDSYTRGVNAFLHQATGSGGLPAEYGLLGMAPETWQPWDCLLVYKVRHIQMGIWEAKAWRAMLVNRLGPEKTAQLFPGYPAGQPVIVPPGERYDGPLLDGKPELERGAPIVALVPSLGGHPGLSPREQANGGAPGGAGGESPEAGSNSWIVGGARTLSGLPLVAGDPHRALEVPNVYYQNHVACPDFDVIGLSIAGVPGFPHFGHNKSVAWCITHAQADYQDLFVEQFDPGDPTRYRYLDGWRLAERFPEMIAVRGEAPVENAVTVTHHGPVIVGEPEDGFAVALRYSATAEPNGCFDAFLPLMQAKSVGNVEEAMRPWVDPANNFGFADRDGAFGYRTRGRLPVRSTANGWLPVPGWTGEHEWQGYIPFEEMPSMRDPAPGFIATANNRITKAGYPHYLALESAPGFRAQRIIDQLKHASSLTGLEMEALHADRVSIPGREFARILSGLEPWDERSSWALDLLGNWDGSMDGESQAALLFTVVREKLFRGMMEPLLGPLAARAFTGTGRGGPAHMLRLRARLAGFIESDDRTLLPEGEDWASAMRRALDEALTLLQSRLGDDRSAWRWDRVHGTRPVHPLSPIFPGLASLLNPPSVEMGGDGETLMAASYTVGSLNFTVNGTSVARYLFDLADWNRSGWVVPLGSSGHPGSPHYSDQLRAWAECRLLPMLYYWDQIGAESECHQLLVPAAQAYDEEIVAR